MIPSSRQQLLYAALTRTHEKNWVWWYVLVLSTTKVETEVLRNSLASQSHQTRKRQRSYLQVWGRGIRLTYLHTNTHTYMNLHAYTHQHTHTHTPTHTNTHTYTHTYMDTHIHTHAHIFTQIHTNSPPTHTHTRTLLSYCDYSPLFHSQDIPPVLSFIAPCLDCCNRFVNFSNSIFWDRTNVREAPNKSNVSEMET